MLPEAMFLSKLMDQCALKEIQRARCNYQLFKITKTNILLEGKKNGSMGKGEMMLFVQASAK